MEEEDKDPFLEDEDDKVCGEAKFDPEEDGPSSPILNTPSFGYKTFGNAGRRKNRMRRSGSGLPPGSSISLPIANTIENLGLPPRSPNDSMLLSQKLQLDFVAPKTPVAGAPTINSPHNFDSDSDEDMFATVPCTYSSEQAIPCALNDLFDGPEHADVSWSSSMATPLTGNVTCSNQLNTEERKVLLPSDDCGLAVRPRALFSPDSNDITDCHSLNISSDVENLKTFKTPKRKVKTILDTSKISVDSPQSPWFIPLSTRTKDDDEAKKSCSAAGLFKDQFSSNVNENYNPECSAHISPDKKFNKVSDRISGDSPILSGSSKFKCTSNQTSSLQQEEKDLFDNTEESLQDVLQCSPQSSKYSSAAESTPNIGSRKKSPLTELSSPLSCDPNFGESFLQDISVTTLEKVCQGQEQRAISAPTLQAPDRQPDTKRKRLLFSTNSNPTPAAFLEKIEDTGPAQRSEILREEEPTKMEENTSCIPDDSFMEHLAAMSTTILSDNFQPEIKVQSIKTSSHIKKFCYSIDSGSESKSLKYSVSSEPQTLMKEILSSVIALEAASPSIIKTKSVKPTQDLVVFSKLKEEINQDLEEGSEKELHFNVKSISKPMSESSQTLLNSKTISDKSEILSSEGFQTAHGNKIELPEEAILKGLSILKDVLNSAEEGQQKVDNMCSSKQSPLFGVEKARGKADGAKAFSNDQMVQAAEEVEQLLQLVRNGEDFNPWHEMEQPSESIVAPSNFKSENVCEMLEESPNNEGILKKSKLVVDEDLNKKANQQSPSHGFSTASGKSILVSEKSLIKAKQLLSEVIDEIVNLPGGETIENNLQLQIQGCEENVQHCYDPANIKGAGRVAESLSPGAACDVACGGGMKINNLKPKMTEETSQADRKRRSLQSYEDKSVIPNKKACLDSFSPVLGKTCQQIPLKIPSRGQESDTSLSSMSLNLAHGSVSESCNNGLKLDDGHSSIIDEEQGFNIIKNLSSNIHSGSTAYRRERDESSLLTSEEHSRFSTALETCEEILKHCPSKISESSNSSVLPLKEEKKVIQAFKIPGQDNGNMPLPRTEQDGFSTASGKAVIVSEEALKKVKSLFDDFSEVNEEVHLSERDDEGVIHSAKKLSGRDGFLTASGKEVNVSEEALKRVKNLFDDLSEVNEQSTPVDGRDQSKQMEHLKKGDLTIQSITEPIIKIGFATASGKSVDVSEEAVKKAKILFGNLPEVNDKVHSSEGNYKGETPKNIEQSRKFEFLTASGKAVNVSKEAMMKAKHVFDDLSDGNQAAQQSEVRNQRTLPTVKQSGNVGFFTASEIPVNVSAEALKKVKNLFDCLPEKTEAVHQIEVRNEEVCLAGELATIDQPSTAKGKTVNVSAKEKVLDGFYETGDEVQSIEERNQDVPHSEPVGFSTASGRYVRVSKDALKKVKNLFDDFSESKEKVNPSNSKHRDSLQPIAKKSGKVEFSTANGKSVNVPTEGLKKVKNLFDDLVEVNDEGRNQSVLESTGKQPKDIGFSTASGKFVNVSTEALKKAKNIFNEFSEANDNTCLGEEGKQDLLLPAEQSANIGGFSTASGRSVSVSKEALRKVKGLTADMLSDSPFDLEPKHTTLSPFNEINLVNVSSEKRAKDSVPMAEFSTASGRSVNITKEALSRARNIFADCASEFDDSVETVNSLKRNKAVERDANDDSGVCSSHDLSSVYVPQIKAPKIEKSISFKAPIRTASSSSNYLIDNKENCLDRTRYDPGRLDLQKTSLTQEITASTAAFLADDEFFNEAESSNSAANTLQTICTSPSLVTDRSSNLMPVISSLSDEGCKINEPTSPILVRNNSVGLRRRSRRGKLSLSNISVSRSSSPAQGTTVVTSSEVHDSGSTGLSNDLTSQSTFEHRKAPVDKDSNHEDSLDNSRSFMKNAPSRKLFVGESVASPVKLDCLNSKSNNSFSESAPSPSKVSLPECGGSSTNTDSGLTPNSSSNPKAFFGSKACNQLPSMKKTLIRNHCGQSSTFRTPYKTNSEEHLKRCPSSPAQNPPEAKRRKSSANLYVSHIEFQSSRSAYSDKRSPRPEVIEMRRRAATEQKQLIDNHTEEKGELLQPQLGTWFSRKTSGAETLIKLSEMKEIEQPGSYSPNDLLKIGLKSTIISITATNCAEFRFSAWDYYSEDVCRENVAGLPVGDGARLVLDSHGSAGVEEVERAFLASPGVDPSLIPSGWVQNHYRWLVWKLAAFEKMFPHHFGGRCLTPDILMLQLKYRYDREIDRCERPALRRILEHDDSVAKRMALCVASVKNLMDSNQGGVGLELELTDGWYSVTACIDSDMQRMVSKGVIAIGTKLIMHSAELLNCPEGCSPLQAPSDVRLKLCSNSTRRARWYTKLGFQTNPGPLRISLPSVLACGGVVSCVSAYIARVYPVVYMEKKDEKTVVRSQRAEEKELAKCEKKRQRMAEIVYGQVQAEMQQEQTKQRRSSVKFSLKQLSTLTTGEELAEILESTSDPLTVQNMLSEDQKCLISEYQRSKQEELCRDLESRVRGKLSENPSNERHVTSILKIRLFDCPSSNQNSTAILSIWRPSEDMSSIFKEGHKITIFGAVANGLRCGELQLSANRSTLFNPENSAEPKSDLLRCASPLSSLMSHGTMPRFGELDIVGLVVRVGPAPQTSENSTCFQTAYLSDSEQNIVGVSFREGIKEFGVEDLIAPCSFLAATNLQWRGSGMKAVPVVYASELSFFTTNPRQSYLQTALQDLRHSLSSDLKAFCRACEEKLSDLLLQKFPSPSGHPRTPAPLKSTPNSSDLSFSKHINKSLSMQKETPLSLSSKQSVSTMKAQRKLAMDQQLNSPSLAKSISSANGISPATEKRIAKLEPYGTPPPLSPIMIPQPRKLLRKEFKAPRRTDSPSVESKKSDEA